jgi:hypothetical protein
MPPGGCALLEGSHHEIKEKIDESFERKVLQMKRYNHLSDNSTTHNLTCI